MDPYELLKADHRKVSELFSEIESSSGRVKVNLFGQIKNELDLHAHVEETIFYPALEKTDEAHDLTLEAYEEHKGVKQLLAELEQSAPSDEWNAKLKVLREQVEHHVDEEEGELFDKARDVLSDEQAERLGNQMQEEKRRIGGEAAVTPPPETGVLAAVKRVLGLAPARKKAARQATKPARAAKKSNRKSELSAARRAAKKSVKSAGSAKKSGATKKSAPARKKSGGRKASPKAASRKASTKAGKRRAGTKKRARAK